MLLRSRKVRNCRYGHGRAPCVQKKAGVARTADKWLSYCLQETSGKHYLYFLARHQRRNKCVLEILCVVATRKDIAINYKYACPAA
jgi:hypothetical protein